MVRKSGSVSISLWDALEPENEPFLFSIVLLLMLVLEALCGFFNLSCFFTRPVIHSYLVRGLEYLEKQNVQILHVSMLIMMARATA